MSVEAMGYVLRQSRATGTARWVLLVIADQCNGDGETWSEGLRLDKIAEMVGGPQPADQPTRRTLQRALRELEQMDPPELEVVQRPGRGRPNLYRLTGYLRWAGKGDTHVALTEEKGDTHVALTEKKGDTRVALTEEKGDTRVALNAPVRATPTSPPIDVPSTTTATESPPPSHPPGDSGSVPELTEQQRCVQRVEVAFDYAAVPRPGPKTIVGMIRNCGGFGAIEQLMTLVRRLAGRGELSEEALFAAIATHTRSRNRTPGARAARGRGTGPKPATLDDSRRRAVERIAEEARGRA